MSKRRSVYTEECDNSDGPFIERGTVPPRGRLDVVTAADREITAAIVGRVLSLSVRGEDYGPYRVTGMTLVLHTLGWTGALRGIDHCFCGGALAEWESRYCQQPLHYSPGSVPQLKPDVAESPHRLYEAICLNDLGVFYDPHSGGLFLGMEMPRDVPEPIRQKPGQRHSFRVVVTMCPSTPIHAARLYNAVRTGSVQRQPFCKYTNETVVEINAMHQEYLRHMQQVRSNLVVDYFRPMKMLFNEGVSADDNAPCAVRRVVGSGQQWEAVAFSLQQVAQLTGIDYGMLAVFDGPINRQTFFFDPKAADLQEMIATDPAEAGAWLVLTQFQDIMGRFPTLSSAFAPPTPERTLGVMRHAIVSMQEFQEKCAQSGLPTVSLTDRDREAVQRVLHANLGCDAVSRHLVCPIGRKVMSVPVVLCGDGITYDYKHLAEFVSLPGNWTRLNEEDQVALRSPVTNQPLDFAGCVLNRAVLWELDSIACRNQIKP